MDQHADRVEITREDTRWSWRRLNHQGAVLGASTRFGTRTSCTDAAYRDNPGDNVVFVLDPP